eukprot:180724_1
MSNKSPPRKKRKLNDIDDDEYVPSDPEEDVSDYAPSDDQFEEDEITTSTNSKKESIETSDDDNDENEEENKDGEEENDENKPKLSPQDKKSVKALLKTTGSWTATQLKTFLRNLKSLRSIDGESVFEDLSLGGKKDELKKRVSDNILMIYLGHLAVPTKNKWSWSRHKVYRETIDFDGWKVQIKQFINVISVQSSKKARKKKSNSVMSGALISRLNACSKEQIISSVELLLEKQQNGSDLAQQLEELLPRPNLQGVFKRHNALINAISKAQPNSRYGSGRDDYCFKRCRSSINTAKKGIISDGKSVMDTGEWDICLEYLVVSSNNIQRFPVWDQDCNNTAVRDLKKKLNTWYGKVVKGLGANVNDMQQKRLKQLQLFLKKN